MRRCLVVANQTLGGPELDDAVRQRIATEPHAFFVVVPATLPEDQVVDTGPAAGDGPAPHDVAYALARQRLDRAVERIRGQGADADGEVGEADALAAVRSALGRFPAEEILVATLPGGISHWLRLDLPARVRRAFDVPVDHLVVDATVRGR